MRIGSRRRDFDKKYHEWRPGGGYEIPNLKSEMMIVNGSKSFCMFGESQAAHFQIDTLIRTWDTIKHANQMKLSNQSLPQTITDSLLSWCIIPCSVWDRWHRRSGGMLLPKEARSTWDAVCQLSNTALLLLTLRCVLFTQKELISDLGLGWPQVIYEFMLIFMGANGPNIKAMFQS